MSRALAFLVCVLCFACNNALNDYAAITTTGELQRDGGGECGAVAIDATHAITAAHCVAEGPVFYHAPGEHNGRRVAHIASIATRGVDVACLTVETRESGSAVGELEPEQPVTLDGNVSGAGAGVTEGPWREGLYASLFSVQGDSGSAVRNDAGDVVALLSLGVEPGRSFVVRATNARELCP